MAGSLLSRALTAISATAALSVGLAVAVVPPASAESSSSCPQADSTRLLTINDGQFKAWLYEAPTAVHLCFVASTIAAGDLIFRGLDPASPPLVTWALDPTCPVFLHVQDPVDVALRLSTSIVAPQSACVGIDGQAIRVTVTGDPGPSPVELWLDGRSVLAYAYCHDIAPACASDYEAGNPIRVL